MFIDCPKKSTAAWKCNSAGSHFHSNDFQPVKFHKIPEMNIVLCNFCAQQIRVYLHIWAGIPSGKHIHPNRAQISWWNPPQLPQPREFLSEIFAFFVLGRKWGWERQREVGEGSVRERGGGWWNWITMVTSITFPPTPPMHMHTLKRGNEFQNGEGASTVICFCEACQATETSLHW